MGKGKVAVIIIVILALVAGGIILALRFLGPKPQQLEAPTVVMAGNVATWEAIDNAKEYEIDVSGESSKLDKTITSYELSDGQTFMVRAVGDGVKYTTSNWSNKVGFNEPPPVTNYYSVTWRCGGIDLEIDENVAYGTMPTYNGVEPTKAADAQYTYTFSGWDPQPSAVTADVVYEAQFEKTLRRYTVTFYSENGSAVLDTVTVDYGTGAVYTKSNPVKNATNYYTYTFDKWVTTQGGSIEADISNITENITVYASFKEELRTVKVHIVPNNAEFGSVSTAVLENIPYDSTIATNENVLLVAEHTITATPKAKDDKYTYTFVGWKTASKVGNDTIIIAEFARSLNTYTITWMNGENVLETDENVEYGSTPIYNGTMPTQNLGDGKTYVFSGWSPAVASVSGNATYLAQFETSENKHIVTYYDEDGTTVLGVVLVEDGATAVYPNALPTKPATANLVFEFEKWVTEKNGDTEAVFTNVTANMSVYAKYTQTVRSHAVTFCNYDGTVISTVNVEQGGSAEAPAMQERDGYLFNGWDKSIDNVTEDITVSAQYVRVYLIEFVDYNGMYISSKLVFDEHFDGTINEDYISIDGTLTVPADPTRNGYVFIGWTDENGYTLEAAINSDKKFTAQYEVAYTVTFEYYVLSGDGTTYELTTEEIEVKKGEPIGYFPTIPERAGFTIVGWDVADGFTVTEDVTVSAVYKIETCKVTFLDPDGNQIATQEVNYGFSAEAPNAPEFFVYDYREGVKRIVKVKGFTGWDKPLTGIKENTTITAIYETNYYKPTILVDVKWDKEATMPTYKVEIYAIMPEVIQEEDGVKTTEIPTLYGFDLGVDIVNVTVKGDPKIHDLWVNDIKNYTFNNVAKEYQVAWADTDGKNTAFTQILTFDIVTENENAIDEETPLDSVFKVSEDSSFILGMQEEDRESILANVVYRFIK